MLNHHINAPKTLLSLVFCLFALTANAKTEKVNPEANYTDIAKRLAKFLPSEHLTRKKLNDNISSMSWTNYLSSLDYERIYFLESDIENFRKHELLLDDQLKAGNISFAYDVFDVFKQRLADRNAYIAQLLKEDLNLDTDEKYVWQRKDMPWAKDEKDWNRIWRQKISNEYIQQLIGESKKSEAETNTITTITNVTLNATNAPPSISTNGIPLPKPATPKEAIMNRHEDMMTIMNDNDAEWVLQKYLSSFCHSYDPHSGYMSPSSMDDFDIEMKLSLVGIGALLRAEDGAAMIVETIPGGPADRDERPSKLVKGDKIIAVGQDDDEPVSILHQPLYKIVQKIRGPKNSRVVLIVIPASDPTGSTTKTVDLIRDEVRLEDAAAKWKTIDIKDGDNKDRKLGVITLSSFYSNMNAVDSNDPAFRSAAYDISQLISSSAENNVEGILLDLRNNGGGSLLEAIMLTGLFIRQGPVVQVRERYWTKSLYDKDSRMAYSGPLVILVNMNSASASEILAGALQDYGRALVIGDTKTHGKGTVQTIVQLDSYNESLGSVRITTASYYRISGGSTQLKGITPDIILPSPWEYLVMDEGTLNNPMPWSMVPSVRYSKDNLIKQNIPLLARQSIQRRASDELFGAYTNQLERIKQRIESHELSLNLEERKKQAKIDKELSKLQEKLASMEEKEDSEEQPDTVLMESLRILADLSDIYTKRSAVEKKQPPQKRKSVLDLFVDWMLNV